MNCKSVDILLATFNGARYLPQQLDSILGQSHPQFQLIVRDDASHDETPDILTDYAQQFPNKMIVLPGEERLGIKGNFSRLMQQAKAPYIMFADQDDIWLSTKIELMLKTMEQSESLYGDTIPLLLHSDLGVIDCDARHLSPSFWRYAGLVPTKGQTLNRLLMQNVVTGCAMMVNRPLLELASPVPDKAIMHDWWMALVAASFGRIIAISTPTVLYRQHGKNAVGAKKIWSRAYIKAGLKKLRTPESGRMTQAEEFQKRYGITIDGEKRNILQAYLSLPECSLFRKIATVFRYRLFKMGFLRNVINIFIKQFVGVL